MARFAFTHGFFQLCQAMSSHNTSTYVITWHRVPGCPQRPRYGLGPLWLFLSATEQTARLPVFSGSLGSPTLPPLPSFLPPHPPTPLYTTLKTFQKPEISTTVAANFVLALRLLYSGVNLTWLQSSIRELQCLEYHKLVCFKIQNVITFVTQSDKTSFITRKYTHVYNYIYLLFCVCYSNSVSFTELLRSFCIHGEACAKILYSEKELLNLKDSKLT